MLTGGSQGSGKGTDKSAARSIDARKPMQDAPIREQATAEGSSNTSDPTSEKDKPLVTSQKQTPILKEANS